MNDTVSLMWKSGMLNILTNDDHTFVDCTICISFSKNDIFLTLPFFYSSMFFKVGNIYISESNSRFYRNK